MGTLPYATIGFLLKSNWATGKLPVVTDGFVLDDHPTRLALVGDGGDQGEFLARAPRPSVPRVFCLPVHSFCHAHRCWSVRLRISS